MIVSFPDVAVIFSIFFILSSFSVLFVDSPVAAVTVTVEYPDPSIVLKSTTILFDTLLNAL